jgi:pyruvate dehydrogenase E1 component beta subunit
MKPNIMHPRLDFMFYAFDPICNHAANWNYTFNKNVPLTVWGIINRGGEQACQHSQAIQAMFCHVPGLKVVAPSNPYDAKGLLYSCVEDPNPTIFIDDRWLYEEVGEVPDELYKVPIGKGEIVNEGKDITIVSYSYMVTECKKAVKELEEVGISVELIDLRTISPIDIELICNSVMKTGLLLVVDGAWKSFGVSAEIITSVNERVGMCSGRLTLPDCPAPSSIALEKEYYINSKNIVKKVREMVW